MMDTVEKLVAIEAIRLLKARYWRAIDTRDPDLLRSIFTDDVTIDLRAEVPEGPNDHMVWRDSIKFVSDVIINLKGVVTAHFGHNPEIEILSATEATAIWPMQDYFWVDPAQSALPFRALRGFGHYHDKCVLTESGWKICYSRLDRVRIEFDPI